MKLNECIEIYHPSFGKIVFKHIGSGLIVDNIFKPTKKIVESVFKPFAEKALKSGLESVGDKLSEKALKSGLESVGDKLSEKAVRKSGHILIKDLQKEWKKSNPHKREDYNVLLKKMISGEGYKKQKK